MNTEHYFVSWQKIRPAGATLFGEKFDDDAEARNFAEWQLRCESEGEVSIEHRRRNGETGKLETLTRRDETCWTSRLSTKAIPQRSCAERCPRSSHGGAALLSTLPIGPAEEVQSEVRSFTARPTRIRELR
jgi:hypothetical protein